MTRRAWPSHLAALLGYVCVAVAFSWPLPLHLSTHLTGDPGGDTGVYVWNQWVFWHGATLEHRNPLTTQHIFSLTDRPVDLSQHNYTVFANLLALPVITWLGSVATFNLTWLAITVLTAWCTFALARRVTGGATAEAWLAGLAFAWSPVLMARSTGHFSLTAAAPLAAFLWALHRVERSERLRDSMLAGAAIAWAAACDPYFAVYCVDIALVYLVSRLVRVEWRPEWRSRPGLWMLDLCILLAGGLVVGLLAGRGGRVQLFGVPVSIRGLYSPVLVLTVLVAARAVVTARPHLRSLGLPRPRAIALAAAGCLTGVIVLSPTLFAAARRVVDGSWVSPPTLWRSSPRGVDLLALVAPNPAHPLVRWLSGDWQVDAPTAFVEYSAGLGLVSLAVIAFAAWRAGLRARGWFWTLALFAALALGPFVQVGGVNTMIPGPWALLRYVPVVNLTRMPGRFAIVAALLVSVLLALALQALSARWPQHRRRLLLAIGALLLVELVPAPRTLYSAAVPRVYDVIRADPRSVRILELPVGVRDGVTSEGDFSARYQFNQAVHGKRLIGGYLSRVSRRRFNEVRASRTIDAMIRLSEGGTLTPDERARLVARAPGFISRAHLAWVVIHPSRTPPALEAFARDAFGLERVGEDGDAVLYRVRRPPGPRNTTP